MPETITQLKKRLAELEIDIAETKRRLPAHSVKPPVMMDLLKLEDERDLLIRKIQDLSDKEDNLQSGFC